MNGNSFGTLFRITTWGESHGPAVGVVIDGCPSGLALSAEDFAADMKLRQGGNAGFTTARQESDAVLIDSGVTDGKTTGTPISLRILNQNQNSADYDELKSVFRPGHADLTTHLKHGHRDARGGGRASARETTARVAAGVVAKKILQLVGVELAAWVTQVGPHFLDDQSESPNEIGKMRAQSPLGTLRPQPDLENQLAVLKQAGDSWGGAVRCCVTGLSPGLGEPIFDKLPAQLAHALLSLPAAVAYEHGSGKAFAELPGSAIRDEIHLTDSGPRPKTNKTGGVLGGLSTGNPLLFTVSFHAPTSIPRPIATLTEQGEKQEIVVKGRHDSFPLPRAIPMVESMAAITLVDFYLRAGKIPENLSQLSPAARE